MGLIALVPTPLVRAPGALFGPGEDPLNPAVGEGIGATFFVDIPSTSSCLLRTLAFLPQRRCCLDGPAARAEREL